MSNRSPKRSKSAAWTSETGSDIAPLLDRIAACHAIVAWGMMGQTEQRTSEFWRMIMSLNRRHEWQWMPLLFAAALLFAGSARAETRTVRIATQYGISYLPMTIM